MFIGPCTLLDEFSVRSRPGRWWTKRNITDNIKACSGVFERSDEKTWYHSTQISYKGKDMERNEALLVVHWLSLLGPFAITSWHPALTLPKTYPFVNGFLLVLYNNTGILCVCVCVFVPSEISWMGHCSAAPLHRREALRLASCTNRSSSRYDTPF